MYLSGPDGALLSEELDEAADRMDADLASARFPSVAARNGAVDRMDASSASGRSPSAAVRNEVVDRTDENLAAGHSPSVAVRNEACCVHSADASR